MKTREIAVTLAAGVVIFQAAVFMQSLLKVPQKPAVSEQMVGRSEAYRNVEDQSGYRIYRNTDAGILGRDQSREYDGIEAEGVSVAEAAVRVRES